VGSESFCVEEAVTLLEFLCHECLDTLIVVNFLLLGLSDLLLLGSVIDVPVGGSALL
jgi:hypothetical protein